MAASSKNPALNDQSVDANEQLLKRTWQMLVHSTMRKKKKNEKEREGKENHVYFNYIYF